MNGASMVCRCLSGVLVAIIVALMAPAGMSLAEYLVVVVLVPVCMLLHQLAHELEEH